MNKKQIIRITERDLHNLIKESVNKILREEFGEDEDDKGLVQWIRDNYLPKPGTEWYEEQIQQQLDNYEEYGNDADFSADKGDNCASDYAEIIFDDLLKKFPSIVTEYDRYEEACQEAVRQHTIEVEDEARRRLEHNS